MNVFLVAQEAFEMLEPRDSVWKTRLALRKRLDHGVPWINSRKKSI